MNKIRSFPLLLAGALLLGVSVLSVPAQAAVYQATLNGLQEGTPPGPNASTATGFVQVKIVGDNLTAFLIFTGLIGGPAAAAHIHCCTPPGTNTSVAIGYPGFPAATSGTYLQTFNLKDAATYTDTFRNASGGTAAGAEAALIAGLNAGTAYSNIHNSTFPGGEIRGNLALVPEPSSALLLVAGMLGVAGLACRRTKPIDSKLL